MNYLSITVSDLRESYIHYNVPERAGDMLFGHRFPPHVPCSTQDALRNVKMLSVRGLFCFVNPYKP